MSGWAVFLVVVVCLVIVGVKIFNNDGFDE